MKLMVFNGSPRKEWNTAQLLGKVAEGARSEKMDVDVVHLYDLSFKGCASCFACKRLGGPSYGRCVMRDDLTPILAELGKADALVMGSPVYMGGESSGFRALFERAIFPYFTYTNPPGTLFPRRIRTALVYTLGAPEEAAKAMGFDYFMDFASRFFGLVFGLNEIMVSYDTLQFDDYSRYESSMFDSAAKQQRHSDVFPQEEQRAFELGQRMAMPPSA